MVAMDGRLQWDHTLCAVVHDSCHLAVVQPGLYAPISAGGEDEGDVALHVRTH